MCTCRLVFENIHNKCIDKWNIKKKKREYNTKWKMAKIWILITETHQSTIKPINQV